MIKGAMVAVAALALAVPASATLVTMQISGQFEAIARFGVPADMFTATLVYDTADLAYAEPTNAIYGSRERAGLGSFSFTTNDFSFSTNFVQVNYRSDTNCMPSSSTTGCYYFAIDVGPNNFAYPTRLVFTGRQPDVFTGPLLPDTAPSSGFATYAEFYAYAPTVVGVAQRIAYIGRSQIDPNAPPSQLFFGPAAAVGGVPEPASWALLIAGFGLVGAVARRRRPLATA